MSPGLKKPGQKTVTEQTMHGRDGDLTIRKDGEKIKLSLSGDLGYTLTFKPEGLNRFVAEQEMMGDGVTVIHRDKDRKIFRAHLSGRDIFFEEAPRYHQGAYEVKLPWEPLKALLTELASPDLKMKIDF